MRKRIMKESLLKSVHKRNDWPNQKDAIDKDINFLWNREVFGPVVHTLKGVKQVRCKWTVAHKEGSIWNWLWRDIISYGRCN